MIQEIEIHNYLMSFMIYATFLMYIEDASIFNLEILSLYCYIY